MVNSRERWRKLREDCGFSEEPQGTGSGRTKRLDPFVDTREYYRRIREHPKRVELTSSYGTYASGLMGIEEETTQGTCFYKETWVPDELTTPWDSLREIPASAFTPVPGRNPGLLDQWIFLDVETTGLGGGVGTVAFMIGIAWWEDHGLKIRQYFLRDMDEEAAMLCSLSQHLEDSPGMVTFNGCAFDRHILNNRLTLNRTDFDILSYPHIDLYHWAKRIWQGRQPALTLQSIEERVLNVQRVFDIRGSEIPGIYRWYLRQGWHEALYRVFEHNQKDLTSLASLTIILGKTLLGISEGLENDDLHFLSWHQGRIWSPYDWRFSLQTWFRLLQQETAPPKLRSRAFIYALRLIRKRRAWSHLKPWLESAHRMNVESLMPGAWSLAAFYSYRFQQQPSLANHFLDKAIHHPATTLEQEKLFRQRMSRIAALSRLPFQEIL